MVVTASLWEQRRQMLHNYTLKVTEKVARKQGLPGSLDANDLVLIGETAYVTDFNLHQTRGRRG